ncbi:hypothetical protein JNO54_08500 [Janibacter sp. YIM B02568]|uniref:hypothetical protein n=1 Tax=Janibacter endophyticus TaxID=2806261 RepID=UPI0019520375|nr:hypothetical protein [Janibacter endophyticus]MBM6546179.1 hypothetical protein [Janibacter endophyticus]
MANLSSTRPGYVMLALGLVSVLLARPIGSGFFHGFFEGAGLALIILGVFFLARALRWSSKEPDEGALWLPSEDDKAGR